MLLFTILCVQVLAVKFTSKKTPNWVNNWDGALNYSPGRNKVITGVHSYHDNGKEDRRWKFYYSEAAGLQCEAGSWTDYKNSWDGHLNWRCPHNYALNAIYSYHDNGKEDRRWKFKCCDIRSGGKFHIHSTHTTSYLNNMDGHVDSVCNPNSVLVGFVSYHSNYHEDRRWALQCAIIQERAAPVWIRGGLEDSRVYTNWDASWSLDTPADMLIRNRYGKCLDAPYRTTHGKQVHMWSCSDGNKNQQWYFNKATGQIKLAHGLCLDAPGTGKTTGGKVIVANCANNANQQWEYDPSTGLIIQQHGKNCLDASQRNTNRGLVHMWPCNKLNYNQQWNMGTGGSKALIGLVSYHSNYYEDRRWKTYYASTPGVRCNPKGWTDYQNDMDGHLNFQCPRDHIMTGISSYHKNYQEDRRWRFRCCDIRQSGFHVSYQRDTGSVNNWDGDMNFACSMNEVLIGLKSWHDNGKEDRLWRPICGTVTQNPPDWDDCSEVNVVDVEVGEIEMGSRKTNKVAKYSVPFKACGNSITPGMSTLKIENSESVSSTESLTLGKTLEETFKFSSTRETTFKMSSSVKAEISIGVVTGSAELGMEFGLKSSFTSEKGKKIGSSQSKTSETGETKVHSVSSVSEFSPEPYQWREARANYIQQDVIVDLRMKAQCRRKDGRTKTLWVDSKLTAAAFSQIEVEFVDRTLECPQSYYKKCECVTDLKSKYLTKDGCQTHPFYNAHPGCYVFKGNNCGNGQGLGGAKPIATIDVCTNPLECPRAKMYIDYPLDEYVFEWSYQPCGGDRYYPGDPEYKGKPINDLVLKENWKHCLDGSHGTLGDMFYESRVQAILACDEYNQDKPGTCAGVYDPSCDDQGNYYLCSSDVALKPSTNSCVWKMQDSGDGRRRSTGDLPKAPEALHASPEKTESELFSEFGSDMFEEEPEEALDHLESESELEADKEADKDLAKDLATDLKAADEPSAIFMDTAEEAPLP